MTEHAKEQKQSSIMLDCVSKQQPCQSPSVPDWSLLPQELLHLIAKDLEDEEYCFDVVHARSVCTSWRSSFPFPSCLLRPSYSLPTFSDESKVLCTVEKIPLFLFRVKTPAVSPSVFYLGDLGRDNSRDHMELPSPLQCSVRMQLPGSDPTLMNMLDCQIISLGHQYRVIGWDPESWTSPYRGVALLPLNKEGGGEDFVVILNFTNDLVVFRSEETRWVRLGKITDTSCQKVLTFRGRFYAAYLNGDIFVIDPYSLEATLMNPADHFSSINYLVQSGNDELFLVEATIPQAEVVEVSRLTCRVSSLDEDAGEWDVVSDFEDRVLFIGEQGNVTCSAKELPDGCGVSGNSMLFTDWPGDAIYFYKYGVPTEYAEDDLNFWRLSREYRVKILNKSPPVVAFRVEH
ncbi:PREDICTED: F-box/kelch-repeat protein At1g64840-like [Camelina sativa]|uniref:F-box/kelch-repeat protein At1g64840-like n=1 Tax=Camelina sativa TaxID=90675 RepID=A0ABM0WKR6_CAMSA|nr:PREDICTED: F-box/kelch-repeat protein At1g64840-like [Camelina sativa]